MEETPQLRNLEAIPVQAEGEELVCLRDPLGFAKKPVFLNKFLVFLVSRMNGQNTLRDIQADFLRATGEILPMEQIQSLVKQLDDQFYLDSEHFRSFYQKQVRDFLVAPARPAHHADTAYERDPAALEEQIRGLFALPDGPGNDLVPDPGRSIRGLIAPHIDYHRGGPTYAHAYKALAEHPGANRFIVFGTCHTPMHRRFALTRKHFETPFGTIETDGVFMDRLASKLTTDYFSDEISHRGEHSIEFQAVFLKHALKSSRDFKIIPILVGTFSDIYLQGRGAGEDDQILAFVDSLRKTMAEIPATYAVVAGADLAHVGRRFGDASGPNESMMKEVEREDLEFLALVAAGDAEGMFRHIAATNDQRRVCGYPPIYMALRVLENPRGELLQYRQWTDFRSGSAVTFAAMAFY